MKTIKIIWWTNCHNNFSGKLSLKALPVITVRRFFDSFNIYQALTICHHCSALRLNSEQNKRKLALLEHILDSNYLFAIFYEPTKAISFISNSLRLWDEYVTTAFYIVLEKINYIWFKIFPWSKISYFSLKKCYAINLYFKLKCFSFYITLWSKLSNKGFWVDTYLLIDSSTLEKGKL